MEDTILLNKPIILLKGKIPEILSLNGVEYWHFLRFENGKYIEIPEFPKVDSSNLTISMHISVGINNFDGVFLRVSNISEDTLFLHQGNDTWKNNKFNDSILFRYVDSLNSIGCKSFD